MSEIYKPKVRPYNNGEKEVVEFDITATPAEQARRIIETHFIDEARYREAMVTHPDEAAHFNKLIRASYDYATVTIGRMITEKAIDYTEFPEVYVGNAVPYSGGEEPVQVSLHAVVADERRNLVA